MDIKKTVEDLVKKLEDDKDLATKFKADPIKTVESVLGVDLPDEALKGMVSGVKAKLAGENFEHLLDKVKHLF